MYRRWCKVTPHTLRARARTVFSPDGVHLATLSRHGDGRLWRLPSSNPVTLLLETGKRSNQRVCRDSFDVVAVVPFPEPDTVWAPATACEAVD